MTASALYEGTIRHRRFAVREHAFRHRIAMAYLDLDEVDGLLGGRLVRRRPGLQRFRRTDHLGDPAVPLADEVRGRIGAVLGTEVDGPVRTLCHLRTLGHCFNPVSFHYAFDRDERLVGVLAEVTSTPWGEVHGYVLPADPAARPGAVHAGGMDKRLHVSPFFGLDQRYAWRLVAPGETLSVHLENVEGGRVAFDATLGLRRRPLTRRTLAAQTARQPAATLRVLALIYGHAAVLAAKRVPVHPRVVLPAVPEPQGAPKP